MDGTRYIHPHTVPFDEGERVILFLASNGIGWNYPGMRIRTDGIRPENDQTTVLDTYRSGSFWYIRSGEDFRIRLRGTDADSGLERTNLMLRTDDSDEIRSRFDWSAQMLHNYNTSPNMQVTSARESYTSGQTREIEFTLRASPGTHGQSWQIHRYFRDYVGNIRGFDYTGWRIVVDEEPPNILLTSNVITIEPNNPSNMVKNLIFSWNVSDDTSGLQDYRYRVMRDDGTDQHWLPWSDYSAQP